MAEREQRLRMRRRVPGVHVLSELEAFLVPECWPEIWGRVAARVTGTGAAGVEGADAFDVEVERDEETKRMATPWEILRRVSKALQEQRLTRTERTLVESMARASLCLQASQGSPQCGGLDPFGRSV